MFINNSTPLEGIETFDEAFALIKQNDNARVRNLYTEDGEETGAYQISLNNGESWQSPRMKKVSKGRTIEPNLDSKSKLKDTAIFYDTFDTPVWAGSDETASWFVGNINNCNILGDEYNIQGLIVSTIFDPVPKYYISFERLVCENQFGNLGKNSSSMYINMSAFLGAANYTEDNKIRLSSIISEEATKRTEQAKLVYDRLATTHLTDAQIKHMFEMLTVNKIAKANEEKYQEAEKELASYIRVYNLDDNQNFKGSLFGFVNACTNINTRTKTNPLDVIKPVLPADVVNAPCNFDYLCRAALLNSLC